MLEVTLARARALGLRVHLLPEWHDVDTVDDVARLRRDLARRPGDPTAALADAALAGRVSPSPQPVRG